MKIKFGYFIILLAVLAGACKKDPVEPVIITFTDARDNHMYKSVEIGKQVWMAENLAYLPSVSPTSVSSETAANYYVIGYEGNNPDGAKIDPDYVSYGVLYNYVAAQTACPAGWHLPTADEWNTLRNKLLITPGKKLKSTTGWRENGNGDNSTGFNAYPCGEQYGTTYGFSDFGSFAFFWTATDGEYRYLAWDNGRIDDKSIFVQQSTEPKSYGFSVRCIKDSL